MNNLLQRNTLLFAAFAVVLIATAALFNACSKQESTVNPASEQQLSPQDLKINNTIKNFRDKMAYLREHPGYKSGESYTADSALWLLEATINYSHTFPNDYYGQLITDTLYLTLSTNDVGEVDMNELAQKYDEMKASISAVYHSKAIDNKGLVLVNLEDISFKSDEVTIEVVAVTGERTNESPGGGVGIDGPFSPDDNWWYGEDKGKCPPHTWEFDAAKQLQAKMSLAIPKPTGNFFYTNLTTIIKSGGDPDLRRPNDPDPEDNMYDYFLYHVSSQNGDISDDVLCMESIEMNIYYDLLHELLFNKIPGEDVPAGYCIESVISMTGEPANEDEYQVYYHFGTFQFGLKVNYEHGEEPSEL